MVCNEGSGWAMIRGRLIGVDFTSLSRNSEDPRSFRGPVKSMLSRLRRRTCPVLSFSVGPGRYRRMALKQSLQ